MKQFSHAKVVRKISDLVIHSPNPTIKLLVLGSGIITGVNSIIN